MTKDAATLRAEIAETRRLADDAKDPEERQRLHLKIIEVRNCSYDCSRRSRPAEFVGGAD